MISKKIRKRNRIIAWVLAISTAYILLVNNSLEFLRNFGFEPNTNLIGVIFIFITLVWSIWKGAEGGF